MTVKLQSQAKTELARNKHTPTAAMVDQAKRGLVVAKEQGHDLSDTTMAAGRKLASGQQISDDHVRGMAAYHAAHEYDCTTDQTPEGCSDMLWGGAPGAAWSASRAAAMDVTSLAEEPVEIGADDELSLEIFVRDNLGEPIELGDSEDGLIWAPILRSGTHATRPGPYGEKLKEPLVVVPGITDKPHKEIGLGNLLRNFEAGAVQHVTVPTTHENGVLDNNGFIVAMKIVESAKRPGEHVLMGGHKMTEPEVEGRLRRGSVANRSCGILHDYVDTETGTQYDQVVEHVALTNKPWIRGMAAYGDLSEVDLSDRCVVPMTLSEAPAPTNLADSVSDGAWDGDASRFTDQQYQRSCLVDRKNGKPAKSRCSLPVREPDGTLNRAAVHSAAGRIQGLGDVSSDQKRAAAKQLVSLYRGSLKEQPPIDLIKLAAVSTKMSEAERAAELLSDIQWGDTPSLNTIRDQISAQLADFRSQGEPGGPPYYYVMDVAPEKALVRIDYGDPDGVDDAWVVPFSTVGVTVKLSDFAQWEPVTQAWITDSDAATDRDELGQILGSGGMPIPDTSLFSDALAERSPSRLQLQPERHHQQGGAMKTPVTQAELDRLELSDEARAVFQKIVDHSTEQATQLAESKRNAQKIAVTSRVAELQDKGFSPGFCAEYERIALGDDGEVAAVLNLSENGTSREVEHTATQIIDRLVNAMPFDEQGKLALKGQANLAESPIGERPPVDAADAEAAAGKKKPGTKTADDILAEWAEADPSLNLEQLRAPAAAK